MSSRLHETYQSEPLEAQPGRRYSLLVYLMLAVAFIIVTRPSIHGNDGVQNYAYLRSLAFDQDLDFSNEYEHYMSRQADWFDRKQIPRDPVTDLPINLYGVGSSLLWAPWVAIAHGSAWLLNKAGAEITLDGYSRPYQVAVGFGSCFYATLALALLFRFLRRLQGDQPAAWAILLIWLASPLFFYMYLHPSMSHANSFFLATMVMLLYLRNPTKWLAWGLLGLASGAMVITRFQDGVLLTALLVGELWFLFKTPTGRTRWLLQRLPLYLVWIIGFAIALIPQVLAWGYLQGSYFSGPRAYIHQGSFSFLAPAYAPQVLFGSNHGVFYWHPALLIAFAGLLTATGYLREKLMSLSAFAAQTWVVASWSIWWAGASFGHRMFISTLPFLAIGAVFTLGRPGRTGTVLRVLLLFLIFWNFGNIIQYGLGWIARQEGVPISELAYNNFIRLPAFVWQRIFGSPL